MTGHPDWALGACHLVDRLVTGTTGISQFSSLSKARGHSRRSYRFPLRIHPLETFKAYISPIVDRYYSRLDLQRLCNYVTLCVSIGVLGRQLDEPRPAPLR